jgi:phenylacetate-CoA ligase
MERYYGTNIQSHLAWLNKTQWWSRKELEELQNKKLRALINHAYHNVPYYNRVFRERNIYPDDIKGKEDLRKLPILTKDIIRKNFPDLTARNIPRSNMIESHSSGSTGEPMKYYLDKNSYSSGWAQTYRCWGWGGYDLGDPYVKISLNPRISISKKIQDKLMNTNYIYALGITEKNLKHELERIKKFNPKIIRGYASYMFVLAMNMKKLDMQYNGATIATTGDILFPKYRKIIEMQFNCKILDGYGGESTPISFECGMHEGYHISEEDVIAEFMKKGEDVAPGETGKIIFSNLNNYAMPFIRYDINDLGTYSDSYCTCGRKLSLMKSIEGRDTDIVVTPKGDFIVVHFFTILFEYLQGVDQFQVVQDTLDKLKIKIVKNDKFNNSDLEYIITSIKNHAGDEMNIDIEFVETIPTSKSGKRRFVISKVAMNI